MHSKVLYIIGPAACGKTALGSYLSNQLDAIFIDADDYHSEYNKQKMSSGTPLSDDDRYPWLISVRNAVCNALKNNINIVIVACSALKQCYRDILSISNDAELKEYYFYLQADYTLLRQRLTNRENHFMPEVLIQSQLDSFEFPNVEQSNFFTLNAQEEIDKLASNVISIIR